MSYRLMSEDEYNQYAPELKDKGVIVVNDGSKFWYLKNGTNSGNDLNQDLLGYILGVRVANVAEVKNLTQEEFTEIKQLVNLQYEFNPLKQYLVRIGGSYQPDELKWKTPEEAVASELVFSLWIRRRDTHIDNRVYVDGIPIFFDHGVAFLHELPSAHITVFSRNNGDHGQPNRWRVKTIEGKMTTMDVRNLDRSTKGAHHFINDMEKFKNDLNKMVELLQETFNKDLTVEIINAGFNDDQAKILNEFLEVNLHSLPKDLQIMTKIIYQD